MIRWLKKMWDKICKHFNPKSNVHGKGNHPNPPNLQEKKL